MNDSGQITLDLRLIVVDEQFDNDDNPYGSFIYHMYTNMDNLNDSDVSLEEDGGDDTESLYAFSDLTIPLIICPE